MTRDEIREKLDEIESDLDAYGYCCYKCSTDIPELKELLEIADFLLERLDEISDESTEGTS